MSYRQTAEIIGRTKRHEVEHLKIKFNIKTAWIASGGLTVLSQLFLILILNKVAPAQDLILHQTTLSPTRFKSIMDSWGPSGIELFLQHYWLDFFHPFFYSIFLFCCLVKTIPHSLSKNSRIFLLALPLIAGLSDEIENLCQLSITLGWIPADSFPFYLGAICARLKWFLTILVSEVVLYYAVKKMIFRKSSENK
jgi:hypothetical protein